MFGRRFKYIHKRDGLVCDSVSNIDNFRVGNKGKFSLLLSIVLQSVLHSSIISIYRYPNETLALSTATTRLKVFPVDKGWTLTS